MDKEYIERQAVIEKCNKLLDNADSCPDQSILNGVKLVRDLILIDQETRVPAADVEPVRHGVWIPLDKKLFYPTPKSKSWYCSKCVYIVDKQTKHCPECGAKMDGGN